jgi:hypothetical protein|tara:strand:+ start:128 stop:409 length:282 start_codon:yes stop_codon:yes gene_type:complete
MPLKPGLAPTHALVMKHLYTGIVSLSFIKKDGTLREMKATLVTSEIPALHQKTSLPNNPQEIENVLVWDVENIGWRTFKMSMIESYEGLVKLV